MPQGVRVQVPPRVPLSNNQGSTLSEAANIIGQPIFGNLDPPAVLSSELIKRNFIIDTIDISDTTSLESPDAIPLVVLRGKQAKPIDLKVSLEDQIKDGDSLIVYQKQYFQDDSKDRSKHLQKELKI